MRAEKRIIFWMRSLKDKITDRTTLLLFALVILVMCSPVWGGYILFALFRLKWCFFVASAYLTFWAGPFIPFFPCCIAITLFLRKLMARDKTV